MAETILALKAGRAFRREGTNLVDPSPTKGALVLTNSDDGLLHLLWRNRETNEVEEVRIEVGCQKLPILLTRPRLRI
jgi:26S proteasome regulatory subunit N13